MKLGHRAWVPTIAWIAIACAPDGRPMDREAVGTSEKRLDAANCETLKATGDFFPQCTNRSAEAELVWPAADDPVEEYPEGYDDATVAKQNELCQKKYSWFANQDPARVKTAQAVCLGNDKNLTAYYKRAFRAKSDSVPQCVWLKMSYALDRVPVPYEKDAKDGDGLRTHFSPCRNRLFMQCLLHGKITRGLESTGADMGGFPQSPIWVLGPTDAAVDTGESLDVTARGAANLISFTSSEMCSWRAFEGDFPTTNSPKQASPD